MNAPFTSSPLTAAADFELRWRDEPSADDNGQRLAHVTVTGGTLGEIHHATAHVADLADFPGHVAQQLTRALMLLGAGPAYRAAAIDEVTKVMQRAQQLDARAELEGT